MVFVVISGVVSSVSLAEPGILDEPGHLDPGPISRSVYGGY